VWRDLPRDTQHIGESGGIEGSGGTHGDGMNRDLPVGLRPTYITGHLSRILLFAFRP